MPMPPNLSYRQCSGMGIYNGPDGKAAVQKMKGYKVGPFFICRQISKSGKAVTGAWIISHKPTGWLTTTRVFPTLKVAIEICAKVIEATPDNLWWRIRTREDAARIHQRPVYKDATVTIRIRDVFALVEETFMTEFPERAASAQLIVDQMIEFANNQEGFRE